jgi:hypothetical protein
MDLGALRRPGQATNAEEYLGPDPTARAAFSAIDAAVTAIGVAERRVTKSQIGFYRGHPFAAVWRPEKYLSGPRPPLVLSVFLRRADRSPRWKQVVEPRPGRFTHHLEITYPAEVDEEVRAWLREAWMCAD